MDVDIACNQNTVDTIDTRPLSQLPLFPRLPNDCWRMIALYDFETWYVVLQLCRGMNFLSGLGSELDLAVHCVDYNEESETHTVHWPGFRRAIECSLRNAQSLSLITSNFTYKRSVDSQYNTYIYENGNIVSRRTYDGDNCVSFVYSEFDRVLVDSDYWGTCVNLTWKFDNTTWIVSEHKATVKLNVRIGISKTMHGCGRNVSDAIEDVLSDYPEEVHRINGIDFMRELKVRSRVAFMKLVASRITRPDLCRVAIGNDHWCFAELRQYLS